MIQRKVAIVCLVILCGVDAILFNGTYLATTKQIITHASEVDW